MPDIRPETSATKMLPAPPSAPFLAAPKRSLSSRALRLAIDPGTRRTGLALLDGQHLVFARVKDFHAPISKKALLAAGRRLIEDQIRIFRPTEILLERTYFYARKDTSRLIALVHEFKAVAREHAIPVIEIGPRTVRKILVNDGNAVKKTVAETVCLYFPELSIHLKQTHNWKNDYWSDAYDATALGLARLIELRTIPPPRRLGS
jgi:Holliday junction resolvasome RuvABC endonuclease subunit